MDRTPSPPRRVRTPPAPLHGPKYDNYEPFSPRRSSRVAAQHSTHHHPHHEQATSPARKRIVRDVTPTSSRQKSINRTAHFALSPPSSPSSPDKARSPRPTRRAQHEHAALDSDSEPFAPTPARRLLSTMTHHGMLPTPAKTPRKRALHTEDSLRPTARVLFANRPSTVEDAMPTPRKAHKSMRSVLDLDSFGEQMSTGAPKIGVYVDSKERVPEREDDENNPFSTRRGKGKAKAAPRKERKVNEKTRQIFEAAARDEGIVYTHRGKTIFRQFDDVSRASDAEVGRSSEDETSRKADRSGNRRITRSAIKPKLLFKEDIDRLKRENGEDDDDEEAPTDIELPIATPSRRTRHVDPSASFPQDSTASVTKTVKRQMSFESWSRVKPSSRASASARGTKRSAPPLDEDVQPVGKRARSER
ncbi:hypothetical protein P171DRAFT_485349 [Karstenula rhodostoma CBS 690.94]|uniref:Uncharacterized protein n=1 Tax=Karstenula rhodostoma CBS 690.94 TaxID=1392251 RepID=A0A9P4PLW8_9PLEO|nr:hypothetical protein P171DRAFT_485349 [Karstenula rhodostoma CBS 690.94]